VEKVVPGNDEEEPTTQREPTAEELKDWLAAFKIFDEDGNGEVEIAEMEAVMAKNNEKHDKESLQAVFDSVDTDGSGGIDFEEFKQMMMNADDLEDFADGGVKIRMMGQQGSSGKMGSNFFKSVAKKEALQQKKKRLKQWSVNSDAAVKEREGKQKAATKSVAASAAKLKIYTATLLGERSKLLWRTNTRLDILLYVANEEVIIVQTSSKGEGKLPTVIYPLVYLSYKAISGFCEKRTETIEENKKSEAELKKDQVNAIANYVVSRMQLEEAKLTSSQSAPAGGGGGKKPLVVAVNKLSADTEDDIHMHLDAKFNPMQYPVPELNIVEALSSSEWDEKMQVIADDIKKATGQREKSNKSLNLMGFSLDTLENLLNSVRFKNRRIISKWARSILLLDVDEMKKHLAEIEIQKEATASKIEVPEA